MHLYVSVDGGATWQEADSPATGPTAPQGTVLEYRYVVTNTGNVPLSNVVLTASQRGDWGAGVTAAPPPSPLDD